MVAIKLNSAPFQVCAAVAFVAGFMGCDNVPVSSAPPSSNVDLQNAVTQNGRGGYDWTKTKDGFEVLPPTDVKWVKRLNQDAISKNLIGFEPPDFDPSSIDGADEDVRNWFSELANPVLTGPPILEEPIANVRDGRFDVNEPGDRLIIADGNVRVIDVDSRREISSFPSPVGDINFVRWERAPNRILVMSDKGLFRLNSENGETLESWLAPQGSCQVFVRAQESGSIAIMCGESEVFALDNALKEVAKLNGARPTIPRLAINDEGTKVFLVTKDALMVWDIANDLVERDSLMPPEAYPTNPFFFTLVPYPGIITNDVFTTRTSTENGNLKYYQINGNLICGVNSGGGNHKNRFTLIGSRLKKDLTHEYYLQDVWFEDSGFSDRFSLGTEPVFELRGSDSGEVAAIRGAKSIRLFRRPTYRLANPLAYYEFPLELIWKKRFDQLDLIYKELSKPLRFRQETSHRLLTNIALRLALEWVRCEVTLQTSEAKTLAKELDQWRRNGSEFALLISGLRIVSNDKLTDFAGSPDKATPEQWTTFQRTIVRARLDLEKCSKLPQPPVVALSSLLLYRSESGVPIQELESDVQRMVELYPNDPDAPRQACFQLFAFRWGTKGATGAFLGALASALPEPHGQLQYVRVTKRLGNSIDDNAVDTQYSGISKNRVLRSIEDILQLNTLSPDEIEFLVCVAHAEGRIDLAQALVDHHYERFGLVQLSLNGFGSADQNTVYSPGYKFIGNAIKEKNNLLRNAR